MDFVVFGFGLGAILMLVGFALRDLGPWLFGSTRDEQSLPEFEGARTTIRKQTLSSIGNAISVGGAGIAVVTFSALLAKTDDDLGSIVVGMSLVLATLGVAAWTYDVFRRYRAAMDIVAAQESAVRERLAPRGKRRSSRPAPVSPATEQLAPTVNPEPVPVDNGMPVAASPSFEDSTTSPRKEQEVDRQPEEQDSIETGTSTVSTEAPAVRDQPDLTADAPPMSDDKTAGTLVQDVEPEGASVVEGPSERRERPATRLEPEPERVELPPLPVDVDDALIDEAVRIEPRFEPKRTVPSWLFEDLETDLATNNASRQEDPVDQFQEAKPFTRPSALERLLSDEPVAEPETPDEQPPRQPGTRQPPRNSS